jgi:hypothetical protein
MASSTGAKRGRKPKENSGAAALIEALKFVALAQQKEGTPPQTHCAIANGRVVAFDGIIACGHAIEADLDACPHTTRLLDALSKCGASLAITQLDSGRLSVKSDRFRAFVPCTPAEHLAAPSIEPDAPCAVIGDTLKAGFELLLPILADTGPQAIKCAALLQANSVVATNGHVLVEFWHGIDLPPNLLIPKAALQAVVKTPKKLAKFGFSRNSATFYFEDESFIKTQLFSEEYPTYQLLFSDDANPWPLPEGFYEGLAKIKSLADNGIVYFTEHGLSVRDESRNEAGAFEIAGLPVGMAFSVDYLSIVQSVFRQVAFDSQRVFFFGNNARGVLMGVRA